MKILLEFYPRSKFYESYALQIDQLQLSIWFHFARRISNVPDANIGTLMEFGIKNPFYLRNCTLRETIRKERVIERGKKTFKGACHEFRGNALGLGETKPPTSTTAKLNTVRCCIQTCRNTAAKKVDVLCATIHDHRWRKSARSPHEDCGEGNERSRGEGIETGWIRLFFGVYTFVPGYKPRHSFQ